MPEARSACRCCRSAQRSRSTPSWRSPTAERPALDWLTAAPFAHRGRHGADRPENSLSAFRAATEAGEGIELDVQACRGGRAIVFHDATLDRLCGRSDRLCNLSAEEVGGCTFVGGQECIPTLDDALALVDGQTPLLIEVKTRGLNSAPLCRSVADRLRSYAGPVAVMSFSAVAMSWFRRHAPQLARGLVVTDEGRKSTVLHHLAFRAARPDFLAYDVRSLPSAFSRRARARGVPVLAWTVRDGDAHQRARLHADQIIHELR